MAQTGAANPIPADLFRLLVQSVRDYAIFLLDPGGHIVSWNEGAERLKGYKASEIIGKHFSVFYPEPVRSSGWPEHELATAAQEGRFEDEGWRIRQDGSRFWANVVITALRNDSGELVGFAKVTRDLTERKLAEEALRQSEERYRTLVEEVRDYAIFMLDPAGHVITWNKGAERLNGYAAGEIIGKHFSVFYPPEAVAAKWPHIELEMARADGRFEDEGRRVRKDGSEYWANVIITAIFDSNELLQGFSKVTRDVSERKRLEDATRALNEQLHARVEELNSLNRELREKSEEIETFVYSVSHDVRGPLVNLQGFNEEIQRSCADLLQLMESDPSIPSGVRARVKQIVTADIHESTRFMEIAVEHLGNIVDALLRLSRIGRIVYERRSVDVKSIVGRVLSSMRGTIENQRAEIAVLDLPPALGDSGAIEQVFSNLIANALRYRDPARPCRIEIGGSCQPERKSVMYYVKDNGLGIAPTAMSQLFTAFRRFHPEAGPGEGMGLLTVRRILERLGGKIRVESVQGEGSKFLVELPGAALAES